MPKRRFDSTHKILPLSRLLKNCAAWSRQDKRVVFTNGVFDILHTGHVELLERAKSLGDVLIVGVNSDASARRLGKGPERPINPLQDRQRVLAGLACVDAVVSFGEDNPEKLLSRVKPDVLVKGADYQTHQVAGRQYAQKVVLIPLKKGKSTTNLVLKIRESTVLTQGEA